MEIDQSQSSTSTSLNSDRDIVFELLGQSFAHEVKVSRKILHACRDRCQSFRSKPGTGYFKNLGILEETGCVVVLRTIVCFAGHAFHFVQVSLQLGLFRGMLT